MLLIQLIPLLPGPPHAFLQVLALLYLLQLPDLLNLLQHLRVQPDPLRHVLLGLGVALERVWHAGICRSW